ncbi:MAG TPA: phosphatase PAP2 family protein [Polyangiaceae bacterium]|nr:phosphatase PAP2 family protein [Polyangiaceae bacterium]
MAISHADLSLDAATAAVAPAQTARARAVSALRQAVVLLPFVLTGALYELCRGRLFGHLGAVHVGDLAALEARFFSVTTAQGTRPLSEVIASHTNAGLDLWCGATYLLFLIEIIGVCIYLSFRHRSEALEVSVGFLVINLIGWLIWVAYPAAPPWYVDSHGLQSSVVNAVSSPAGLQRFDALLGVPLAAGFYAKSANVFGAMPSLHVAYATFVACVGARHGRWLRLGTLGFALSMAYSAVYSRHHYLLDVLAGIFLAFAVVGVFRAVRWFVHRGRLGAGAGR